MPIIVEQTQGGLFIKENDDKALAKLLRVEKLDISRNTILENRLQSRTRRNQAKEMFHQLELLF